MNVKAAIVGGVIGGILGTLIATIITDEIWPDYYSDEELAEYDALREKYDTASRNILANQGKSEVPTIDGKGKKTLVKKQYDSQYFQDNPEKAELEKLTKKFNDGFVATESTREAFNEESGVTGLDDIVASFNDDEELGGPAVTMLYADYLKTVDVNTDIHIMSDEDYAVNPMKYKQTMLHYYEDDDVLTDDSLYPIKTNPEKLLGKHALFAFGTFTDDEDVVHVSNPIRGMAYRVIRHLDSYQHAVVENVKHENVFDKYDNKLPSTEEEEDDIS